MLPLRNIKIVLAIILLSFAFIKPICAQDSLHQISRHNESENKNMTESDSISITAQQSMLHWQSCRFGLFTDPQSIADSPSDQNIFDVAAESFILNNYYDLLSKEYICDSKFERLNGKWLRDKLRIARRMQTPRKSTAYEGMMEAQRRLYKNYNLNSSPLYIKWR